MTETTTTNPFHLGGKVALVVGGYGALGSRISWALAAAGARVTVSGRNGDKAETLAADLCNAGHAARGLAFDANAVVEIDAAVDALVRREEAIDILVNCLGIQREQSLPEITEDAFDALYRTNLKAAHFLAQAAARRQIAARRGGKQVHLLSIRAQLGLLGRGYSAYCATKGAQAMLIKQHAAELAPHDITVNGIAPALVRTHKNDSALSNPETYDRTVAQFPLRRIAEPEDIAGAALFFASPASDFVTGQTLYIDGGVSCCR